jgi:hypothetical protein
VALASASATSYAGAWSGPYPSARSGARSVPPAIEFELVYDKSHRHGSTLLGDENKLQLQQLPLSFVIPLP